MTYEECCKVFCINDIQDLPAKVLEIVIGPIGKRDDIYRELLRINDFDVSYDWFQSIFEEEMSEGKRKGQHFTPKEIYSLLSQLSGDNAELVHEPTAGNGGLIIGDWWRRCSQVNPWRWEPQKLIYYAWELSQRSVPFLLLNLSIRGIQAEVTHGDVLEQSVIARYKIINETNNPIAFSKVIRVE